MTNPYLVGTIQIPSDVTLTAITQAFPAVATVSIDSVTESNSYQAGQLVKLFIPHGYGMQQINEKTVEILSVSGDEITLDVDTRNVDPFSVPASGLMPASMSPAGSRNLSFSNSTANVPFQSLNNRGN